MGLAANALANEVVRRVAGYVDTKIATFQRKLENQNRQIDSINARITVLNGALKRSKQEGLTLLDQLVLVSQLDNAEARRGGLIDQQTDTQQLLALAQNVERAHIVEPAVGVATTARSTRNSVIVGAFIGLILGIVAALAWEPVAARLARRPGV